MPPIYGEKEVANHQALLKYCSSQPSSQCSQPRRWDGLSAFDGGSLLNEILHCGTHLFGSLSWIQHQEIEAFHTTDFWEVDLADHLPSCTHTRFVCGVAIVLASTDQWKPRNHLEHCRETLPGTKKVTTESANHGDRGTCWPILSNYKNWAISWDNPWRLHGESGRGVGIFKRNRGC